MCINVTYYSAYFFITKMKGNVFTLGLSLGCAEMTAGIVSGIMMNYYNEKATFLICAVTLILFQLSLYYFEDILLAGSGYGGLVVLYVTMIGVGGVYNSVYCVIEAEMPAQWLGPTLSIGLAAGQFTASLAPQIQQFKMPIPIWITSCLMMYTINVVFFLEQPGSS